MFKKIAVSITLAIIVFLTGCAQNDLPFLDYQSSNFTANASLEINSEKYSVNIIKSASDSYKITFTAPDTLSGVSIEKNGDELFYSVGNVRIPIQNDTNLTAETLKLFMLSEDNLISTDAAMLNGVKVNIADFSYDYGNVRLYISTDSNLPILIKASINGNNVIISLSDFTLIES